MKRKELSFRIIKVGRTAVSVAVCALTGMLMAGGAQAGDVLLGTSLTNVNPLTTVSPTEGSATHSASTWDYYDFWRDTVQGSSVQYGPATTRAGDVFYSNGVTYVYNGVTTTSWAPTASGHYYIGDDNSPRPWADALRASTYIANTFGQIIDTTNGNNYFFGAGATIDSVNRGSQAYTTVTLVDYGNDGTYDFNYFAGSAAVQNGTKAIDINGTARFYGDNTVNGTVEAKSFIYVSGNNVNFNKNVYIYDDIAGVRQATTNGNLVFATAGSANLNNGAALFGNVNFGGNDATLTLSYNSNVRGDVYGTGTDNGTLTFESSGYVTGAVGPIKSINVTGNQSLVQLNTLSGNTQVNNLNITADKAVVEVYGKLTGNVTMNGHYSKLELRDRNGLAAGGANGMVGTLDFGMYKSNLSLSSPDTYGKGTLEVGDNVNVKFSNDPTAGIKLANADNATLIFAGNSVVTGDVGSAAAAGNHNTPFSIYAGATNGGTGGTVNFLGRVYVGAGNLNIGPSNNTVTLSQGLTGNLVFGVTTPVSTQGDAYNTYGDLNVTTSTWGSAGTVKVADGQTITGSITTLTNNTGTLNFLGASSYLQNIGTSGAKLVAVNFNSATAGTAAAPVATNITGNVYATLVTIGNGAAYTTATLTPGAHALGDGLVLAGVNTVLTTDNSAITKNADGTLANTGTSQTTVGAGGITTNGATLNFSVDAGAIAAHTGAIVPASSSTLSTTGALTMLGTEKVNVNLLGSTANGKTINLITAASATAPTTAAATFTATDNSYVIDTTVTKALNGTNLVMTTSRADGVYITKSATTGHFSNGAALRLGVLGAAGANYTSDMQTVFNKLDIDQWGYGNNQANLANQVKRLAPVANGSIGNTAIAASTLGLNTIGNRLSILRGESTSADTVLKQGGQLQDGHWVKLVGSSSKREANGDYDGYKASASGFVWGTDTRIDKDLLLGLSIGSVNSNVTQQDLQAGSTSSVQTLQLAGYFNYNLDANIYFEGALAYGKHAIDGNRSTALGRVASASYNGNQLTARVGAGYRIFLEDKQTLTPMVSLEANRLKNDAYTETGAGALSLNMSEQKLNVGRLGLGLRYATETQSDGVTYRPELTAVWYRDGANTNRDITASYVGDTSNTTFVTPGAEAQRGSAQLGAGVTIMTSKTSAVQLNYAIERRTGFTGQAAQATARWDF